MFVLRFGVKNPTWRIIPVSKCLINVVSMSAKDRVVGTPSKWPKWFSKHPYYHWVLISCKAILSEWTGYATTGSQWRTGDVWEGVFLRCWMFSKGEQWLKPCWFDVFGCFWFIILPSYIRSFINHYLESLYKPILFHPSETPLILGHL